MAWCYLDLADFLFIAEAVLDIPAEDLARVGRLELADSALHAPGAEFGGVEFYPDLARKTAVLASRLIGNHPLPDGNNRVGYLCVLDFIGVQLSWRDVVARLSMRSRAVW
jgi:death on curing protein